MSTIETKEPTGKNARRIARSLETFDPGLENGSIVRWTVDYDGQPYSFAAVWARGQWYTTSVGSSFQKQYSHADFMQALVKGNAYGVGLATVFDKIK